MYVKSIKQLSNSPVVVVEYREKHVSINLRNVKTMTIREMKSFEMPWIILEVTVWKKKDYEEQRQITASLWIDCETEEEAEKTRKRLVELHKKICKCEWSTGIHDGPTVGRGELSEHGYWQYPCYLCAREAERERSWKNVWPWSDEYLAECRQRDRKVVCK